MEVASGVFAVVSLGIQLAESVQKIRKVLRGVKEAPEELQRLIAKIDMLHRIFNRVNTLIEQQRDMPSHHGLIPLFEVALQACARSVNRLESELARVQGSSDDGRKALEDRPKKSMRKHHALRAVLRKETVDDLCSVIDESLREMSLVLHLNSTELILGNHAILQTIERHEHTIQALITGSTAESSTSEDGQQTLVVQTQKT
ncbi:MAG: hypothetical protein OHK93_004451 [Ramalina farinacea]|uniref:Fungal N-terminal domain-containing protein n=1 Tax=Ramalina farinacea TaxID=258253 RepID=A0AA43QVW8_9LECA|nr:hypothetical protein [Ramalina farinacea]